MRTKVCHIMFGGLGGHASVVFSIVVGDKRRNWQHSILTYGIEPLQSNHVNRCKLLDIPFEQTVSIAGSPWICWPELIKKLRSIGPRTVILHSLTAILPVWLYCLFTNSVLIVVEHTPNQVKTRGEWAASFLSQFFANRVVFLTPEYALEIQKKLGPAYRRNRARIIPNGIDLQKFSPKPLRDCSFFSFGMAARFSRTKIQSLLVDVLVELKKRGHHNVRLLFAGDGETMLEVKRKAEESTLSDSIIFAGLLGETDLVSFLNSLDVYVHASTGETMSTSIMQSLACGLPVVASDIPGIKNLIPSSIGLLARNSVAAFSDSIETVLVSSTLRERLAQTARLFAVKNFGCETQFLRYADLVSEVGSGSSVE